jgi:hypothetical protein
MISTLDARGLYTFMLDSSERGMLPSDLDPSGAIMRLKEQNRADSMTADGAVMDELASPSERDERAFCGGCQTALEVDKS